MSDLTSPPEAELRSLTPAEILGEIHFGETKGAIPYNRRPRFRAFWFMATAGDRIAVTATSSSGSASVLVADDTFADVPGNATATLSKSGKYYVAVRDSAAKTATLTVTLARTNVATSAKVADVSVGPYGTCAPNQFGALGVPVAITSLAYDAALGAASLAPIEIP